MLLFLTTIAFAAPAWTTGYTGHMLLHPGAHLRAEQVSGAWRLGGEAGLYVHPSDQLALWVLPRAALHHRGKRDGVYEVALGTGLERTFWFNPSYAVVDGELKRRPLAGDTDAVLRVDLASGRATDGAIDSWLIRPSLAMTLPHMMGVGLDFLLALDLHFGGAR